MVREVTNDLPDSNQLASTSNPDGHHIVLTGSTGFLGSYILYYLLQNTSVSKIYCLNRSPNGKEKQVLSFEEKGLHSEKATSFMVEYLQFDLLKPRLGQSEDTYLVLTSCIDTVIHNAWPVDFTCPLEDLSGYVRGMRNLVDFSAIAKHHPQIFFISTIGTIIHWPDKHSSPVPEGIMEDNDMPLQQGYTESKQATDQILEVASSRLGISCTVIRTGQLAGPTTEKGFWKLQEFYPSLIATSINLGQAPLMEGELDKIQWVPRVSVSSQLPSFCRLTGNEQDTAGKIVAEITLARQQGCNSSPFAVFNMINPNIANWSAVVVPAIQEMYDIQAVPVKSWAKTLFDLNSAGASWEMYPALNFQNLLVTMCHGGEMKPLPIETSRTQEASPTLQCLQPVSVSWVRGWLQQWQLCPELMLY